MKKKKSMNIKLEVTRQKAILFGIPVFGLLLGLMGYLVFVSPQNAKAKKVEAQVVALQVQLAAAQRPTSKPVPVQAADLFRLAKAMPDSSDLPGVIRTLSRMASESKVTITQLTPHPAVPLPSGYGALPIQVTVEGSFPSVSKFLATLRNQVKNGKKLKVDGRLLLANSVDMTTATSGGKLTAELSLDAFIYGMAPPAPVATDTTTTTSA